MFPFPPITVVLFWWEGVELSRGPDVGVSSCSRSSASYSCSVQTSQPRMNRVLSYKDGNEVQGVACRALPYGSGMVKGSSYWKPIWRCDYSDAQGIRKQASIPRCQAKSSGLGV